MIVFHERLCKTRRRSLTNFEKKKQRIIRVCVVEISFIYFQWPTRSECVERDNFRMPSTRKFECKNRDKSTGKKKNVLIGNNSNGLSRFLGSCVFSYVLPFYLTKPFFHRRYIISLIRTINTQVFCSNRVLGLRKTPQFGGNHLLIRRRRR